MLTGGAQITRGIFEAFIPFGKVINLSLDFIGTAIAFQGVISDLNKMIRYPTDAIQCSDKLKLHKEPIYKPESLDLLLKLT